MQQRSPYVMRKEKENSPSPSLLTLPGLMKPFIKKLKTENGFYIYDINSNRILKTDRITFDIVDDYFVLPKEEVIDKWKAYYDKRIVISSIDNLHRIATQENLFSSFKPKMIKFNLSENEIIQELDSNINQLTLEITERCNLRCEYCVYSGKFRYKRTHGNKKMPIEIAKRAVDFYLEHSRKNNEYHITFYGGEPLLEFNLIKRIVEYAKNKARKKILFGITTNGTLLTKKIGEYLLT